MIALYRLQVMLFTHHCSIKTKGLNEVDIMGHTMHSMLFFIYFFVFNCGGNFKCITNNM